MEPHLIEHNNECSKILYFFSITHFFRIAHYDHCMLTSLLDTMSFYYKLLSVAIQAMHQALNRTPNEFQHLNVRFGLAYDVR